jgi:DNA-binding GntR family transcriptional regulator
MKASERVYNALRREIVDGELAPGVVLAEVEQSARFGVSRTPLREALSRLAAEELVSAGGSRGFVVAEVSVQRISELFEVRVALECAAAGLAARHRDRAVFERLRTDFQKSGGLVDAEDPRRHEYYGLVDRLDAAVDAATGNPYLVSLLGAVRTHIARIRRLSHDNPDRLRDAAAEHLLIIDAIIDGSEPLAAHATELHLHRSLAAILSSLQTNRV